MAYTKAGLSPDGGASYVLPRLVGLRRTQELMITNRVLKAPQALEWGLVTAVVADADLPAKLEQLAGQIAAGAKGSNSAVKQLLLNTYGADVEAQMELEARFIAGNAAGADGKEGVAAFLGKRAPEFN
jgi:2-(1,2-epoxy-1,2-dihydrophenyl)acetyl-CoA isomerase